MIVVRGEFADLSAGNKDGHCSRAGIAAGDACAARALDCDIAMGNAA